jgi:hypothetical protein
MAIQPPPPQQHAHAEFSSLNQPITVRKVEAPFTGQQMVLFILASFILPIVGLIAGIIAVFNSVKRPQGVVLIVASLVAWFINSVVILPLILG